MRKTSKVKEVKMNRTRKVKPSIVEAATEAAAQQEKCAEELKAQVGCGIWSPQPPMTPRFYHTHEIEMSLSDFLSRARAANRGESLLHLENARVFFEQACESLRKANHQECRL